MLDPDIRIVAVVEVVLASLCGFLFPPHGVLIATIIAFVATAYFLWPCFTVSSYGTSGSLGLFITVVMAVFLFLVPLWAVAIIKHLMR